MTDPDQLNAQDSEASIALWIAPLLAAVVTPGLVWIVAERPFAVRSDLALGMTLVVGVVALVAFAALSRGFRYRVRWSLGTTSIITLTLFQWPTLSFAGETLEASLPIPMLADLFPVLLAVAFLWVATRLAGEWPFAVLTAIGGLLVSGVLLSTALPNVVTASTAPRGAVAETTAPDVVLMILDGYTRTDILDEQFAFDNTPFLEDLEQLEFTIAARARSNYSFTYASIASMLDLDYVYDLGPIGPSEHEAMRNALSGDNAMMSRFREAGYEVAYLENAWAGSHCGTAVDICIRDGLAERVLWNVGQITIFAPLLKAARPHPFNTVSVEQLEALPEIIEGGRTEGVPRLTVAHFLLPHPPFLLDAACDRHNTPVRRAFTTPSDELIANRRQLYSDQATCVNRLVVESLQQIVEERDDIIVMITADHGSGSTRLANAPVDEWSDAAIAERMSILSAYRVPGCESHIYPSITPANGTRTITNCATGASLSRLADNSYWAPSNGKGLVTDVAWRLDTQ